MKSMIRNVLGGRTFTTYVPATDTVAASFASSVLDGEFKVYAQGSVVGSDAVDIARDTNVMLQDTNSGAKTYLRFLMDASKNEGDVISALNGKTINGVTVDKVVIVSMRSVEF